MGPSLSERFDQDGQNLAEIIDHLISLPVFSGSSLASRPVVLDLYQAARTRFKRPLSLDAAEKIISTAEPARNVLITTGFIVPPWLAPETDGPVGSVSLARTLNFALNLVPIIVTERSSVEKMKRLLEVGGFNVREFENLGNAPRRAAVVPFTLDTKEAKVDAEGLIQRTNPTAMIAIEKASPNRAGVFHSGVGVDVSPLCAKVDALIELGKISGIPTVGIGDAGNEIGMGCIEEEVRKILPTGQDCGCPCHQGVASSVQTDSLIVAGTSNWGAPAIEALLAFLYKAPELLHDSRFEEYLIQSAGALGFVNPASGFGESGVDAIPASVHGSLINMLNFIVSSRIRESFTIRKYRELTNDRAKIQRDVSSEAKNS